MFIPEKMKLNRFQHVNIPKNRSYFSRYGFNNMDENSYTGDEVAPPSRSKIDTLALMDERDKELLSQEGND